MRYTSLAYMHTAQSSIYCTLLWKRRHTDIQNPISLKTRHTAVLSLQVFTSAPSLHMLPVMFVMSVSGHVWVPMGHKGSVCICVNNVCMCLSSQTNIYAHTLMLVKEQGLFTHRLYSETDGMSRPAQGGTVAPPNGRLTAAPLLTCLSLSHHQKRVRISIHVMPKQDLARITHQAFFLG